MRETLVGLTCAELAHLAGISHGSVSFIETGKNQPRTDTVERLARALKVPRAWLAFGDGRKPDFAKGARVGTRRDRQTASAKLGLGLAGLGLSGLRGFFGLAFGLALLAFGFFGLLAFGFSRRTRSLWLRTWGGIP
jgi:transcriptional regulator with XRE-family HTH domain